MTMRNILTVAQREFAHYLATPIGWLVLCAFLIITGLFFSLQTGWYATEAVQASFNPYQEPVDLGAHLIAPFFGDVSVILLMLCPALSMRLFAEDRRQRSLELLLTSPLSTAEIVLGKYLGGMLFVTLMLTGTLLYPLLLAWFGDPDPGVVLCSYLAVFLQVSSFMAVGMLASAFTESQMVALVSSFALLLAFWIASWAGAVASGTLGEVLAYVSMLPHTEQLGKGIIHSKDFVYYLSFVSFALFATHQRVEAYRWE